MDVFLLDNGLGLFKFENPQTRTWVLEGGPWFIAQCPLLLKKWAPDISLERFSLSKIPLWINLRSTPMELFTNEGFNHIASAVGIPLFMDKATELRDRLSFAKVCVEIFRKLLCLHLFIWIRTLVPFKLLLNTLGGLSFVPFVGNQTIMIRVVRISREFGDQLFKMLFLQKCQLTLKVPNI